MEVFEGKPLPELQSEYREIMEEYQEVAGIVRTKRASEWAQTIWSSITFNAVEDYLSANRIVPADRGELEEAFKKHEELLAELGYNGRKIDTALFPDGSNELSKEAQDVLERLKFIPPDENHEFVRGTQWK